MSDAMGQSRLERFYAFVQTNEGDLGEQLVRNGLARAYGFKAAPPGLRNSRTRVEKLQQLEDQAKQERIGAWGINAGRLNAQAQTPSAFSSFVPERETRSRSAPVDSSAVFSPIATTGRLDCAQQSGRDKQSRMPRRRHRSGGSTSTLRQKKS